MIDDEKETFVPLQIAPVGDGVMDIVAVPVLGVEGVSVPKFVLVLTPVKVPEIEDGLMFPATEEKLVA